MTTEDEPQIVTEKILVLSISSGKIEISYGEERQIPQSLE